MKRRLMGRGVYFPGALYSIVLCLPVIVLLIFFMSGVYTIEGRGDPIGIAIAAVFIALYMIFLKPAGKLFAITENFFKNCSDADKAHKKAVLTEFAVFSVFLILLIFIITIII